MAQWLRRPFIVGGVVAGAVLSGWYICREARAAVPHPVWTRFVNVALIMFTAIYLANLIRRVTERVGRRSRSERPQARDGKEE